jgi:hypothetical protein
MGVNYRGRTWFADLMLSGSQALTPGPFDKVQDSKNLSP